MVQGGGEHQAIVARVEGEAADLLAVDGDVLTGLHVHRADLLHPVAWRTRGAESADSHVPSFPRSLYSVPYILHCLGNKYVVNTDTNDDVMPPWESSRL